MTEVVRDETAPTRDRKGVRGITELVRALLTALLLAALLLLKLLLPSTAWLWLFSAGVVVLAVHALVGAWPLLFAGALLVGAAVGVLLEGSFRWSGSFLVSVGTASVATEALAESRRHWAFVVGLALIGLGLVVGLIDGSPHTRVLALATAVAVAVWVWVARRRATD